MAAVYYVLTVLFSATQSVFSKKNAKANADLPLFLFVRSAIASLIFGAIMTVSGTVHLRSLPYGILYGLLFSISMYCGYMALKSGPMGLTSAMVTFSLIIPIFYCVLFLDEDITTAGYVGIILTILAILFINAGNRDSAKISGRWWIYTLSTLVANGICSVLQKMHATAYPKEGRADFMFWGSVVGVVIFMIMILSELKKKTPIFSKTCIVNGCITGAANGFSAFLTLFLASVTAGGVLFPVISVSTMTAALLCGKFVFREKLVKKQLIGFVFAALAIFFLQI